MSLWKWTASTNRLMCPGLPVEVLCGTRCWPTVVTATAAARPQTSAASRAVQTTRFRWSRWMTAAPASPVDLCFLNQVEYVAPVWRLPEMLGWICFQINFVFSGPCPPHNLSAQLSCLLNDLTVTWDAVRDADHFLVSLTAENGGTNELCNTTNTACSTSNLTCGNTYTIQVTSVRGDCQSEHNQSYTIQSGMKNKLKLSNFL